MFHSLTTRPNYYCNLPHPQNMGYVSNPVTALCNDAEKSITHGLEEAGAAAKAMGIPSPVDVVMGFERGCHLSGESNVILLIGWKTVHAIALSSVDDMFIWADFVDKIFVGKSFQERT